MGHTSTRLPSIDALRGLVMIIMALDHVRDFFHADAMLFQPEDLARTNLALFFTRWVTHICAPVFFFTAGIGAWFWTSRPGRTPGALSRFLLTRGLWLVVLELTVLRFAFFFHLTSGPIVLTVLWALGGSMIALALLARIPVPVLAPVSLTVIAVHNLADPIRAAAFGPWSFLWKLVHEPGVFFLQGVPVIVAYPLIPWIAVMSAGYCFGALLAGTTEDRRQRAPLSIGGIATIGFLVLRATNVYGDPAPWSADLAGMSLLSFLRTTKYPPSLQFLLMTLGPAILLLAWFDRRAPRAGHPLLVIGRVPLFFFLVHFLVAHLLTIPFAFLRYGRADFLAQPMPSIAGPNQAYPPDFGYGLPAVYLVWVLVLVIVYPACLWFSRVKRRRTNWWLGYL